MKNLFDHIIGETPDDTAKFIDKSMDIADQIMEILRLRGWTQKELAGKLDKSESEISKWLTGTHNFTLRSITKIESILNEDIIVAPMYWNEYSGIHSSSSNESKNASNKNVKNLEVYYEDNLFNKDTPFVKGYINNNLINIVPDKIIRTNEDYISISKEKEIIKKSNMLKAV